MTDKEFYKINEFAFVGGGFIPHNANAQELSEQLVNGEIVSFTECTQRDLKRHRCYMSLLAYIYDYLPAKFKAQVEKDKFYIWLKHLQGKYKVLFEFKDGTKLVEYESISFAKMSEVRFREFIKEQLPYIYEEVIHKFFDGEIYNNILDTIEQDYKKFFDRL